MLSDGCYDYHELLRVSERLLPVGHLKYLFPFCTSCQECDQCYRNMQTCCQLFCVVNELVGGFLQDEEPADERCDVEADGVGVNHFGG